MSESSDTSAARPSRSPSWRRPVAASLTALAVVSLALALVGLTAAAEQAAHPPTCHGIGFGCTPSPSTTVFLGGYLIGLPAVVVAWTATWVGWALTRDRSARASRAAAWWPVWALTAGTVVLAAALTVSG